MSSYALRLHHLFCMGAVWTLAAVGFSHPVLAKSIAGDLKAPPHYNQSIFNESWDLAKAKWPRHVEDTLFPPRNSRSQPLISSDKSYALILNFYPEHPFDFRSPERFKRSVIGSTGSDFSAPNVGHMVVGLQCALEGRAPRRAMVALTGEYQLQTPRLLDAGWGLSSFFLEFTDGWAQTQLELDRDVLAKAHRTKRAFSFLVVEISSEDCTYGERFIEDFAKNQSRPYARFGMLADPLQFQGGGCISFGQALLDRIGIFNDLRQYFKRQVSFPSRLLGRGPVQEIVSHGVLERHPIGVPYALIPNLLWENIKDKRSKSVFSLLFEEDWTPRDYEPLFSFKIDDSEFYSLFNRYLTSQVLSAERSRVSFRPRHDQKPEQFRHVIKTQILKRRTFKYETVLDRPWEEPIYIGYDKDFNGESLKIKEWTDQWLTENLDQGSFTFFPFLHGYGLLIENVTY